jgi:FkbM family methyltransferase
MSMMMTAAAPAGMARLIAASGRFAPTRRLALKSMIWLRATDRLPRYLMAEVNGRQIALDLDETVDAKLFVFGAFDRRGLRLMGPIMKAIQCRTALDIGANIGNHTAFFCDWAQRVIAFEPNPPICRRLNRLIDENALHNVVALSIGLSDQEGELNFYTTPGAAGMASLEAASAGICVGTVPVARGDAVLRQQNVTDVDFIKIDVEGHEREVLRGLQGTIGANQPVIVAEYGETSIRKFAKPESLQGLLAGYQIYGTTESLLSRLFKTALSLERFRFDKSYSHILCIPSARRADLSQILRFPGG